ncbi:MAG: membrane protein insertase YidC [Clostridia bacterium]|nr:membrane protein insertase YidC [Clostridia bacterium]
MDIIGLMATDLNLIGKLIYNVLYKWVNAWAGGTLLGAFSITVILFTVFLKAATSPFDVWQKVITRKNAKIMEVMKPQLDKITKQCGNNRELLMQKQRALYKQHKYSTFASCLPMLITLAIFIVVFSGFNSAVRFHNSKSFDDLSASYTAAYQAKTQEFIAEGKAAEQDGVLVPTEGYTAAGLKEEQIAAAEKAVLDNYKPERFLLTANIFMPDTWSSPVPSADVFSNTGIGKLGIKDVDANEYNKVMRPLIAKYNYSQSGKKTWNGYLILPILAFILNLLSTKLNKPPEQPQMIGQTEEQKKAQAAQTKMLTYLMPVMMTVFTFLYSTAFALYMFMNSFITTMFNLVYNIVAKKKDAKEKDYILSTTIKK